MLHVDNELEEIDLSHIYYRPECLDKLMKETKFSKRELKVMYRGYKQVKLITFSVIIICYVEKYFRPVPMGT